MKPNITSQLKKFLPHLLKAKEESLHEADTSQIVMKIFEDVLGYNPLTEITHELAIKGHNVDLTIKIDSEIKLFIEIKAADTSLRDRHADQAKLYAGIGGIHWVLLTNGFTWNLFHLSFDDGLEFDLVFSVDLTEEPIDRAAEMIGLLHRSSVKAGAHDDFFKEQNALGAESIGRAIFTEEVILLIRRKIRQKEHILIGSQDLADAIHSLFTIKVQTEMGPAKIHAKKAVKPELAVQNPVETPPNTTANEALKA